MGFGTYADFVEQLPPGRCRQKYEQKSARLGEVWVVHCVYGLNGLWLVQGLEQVEELIKGGTPRHAIWTLAEVQGLMEACGSPVHSLEEAARLLASDGPTEGTAEC
jgi:hypothetical protein